MANEKRLIKVVDATAVYNGFVLYMAENAYLNDTPLDVLKMVADWLNEAPTVDAVEVVRCKDCKYFMSDGCAIDAYTFDVTEESFVPTEKGERENEMPKIY